MATLGYFASLTCIILLQETKVLDFEFYCNPAERNIDTKWKKRVRSRTGEEKGEGKGAEK
jgi:hypothetical protein